MDTSNPGPLLMLGGGVLMFIGSILKWRFESSGVSTDSFGLLGLFVLVFGAAIAGIAAVRAFAPQVSLPERIAGFSIDQIALILGFTAFVWTFTGITATGVEFGLHLSWIGAAAATVGAFLAQRSAASTNTGL